MARQQKYHLMCAEVWLEMEESSKQKSWPQIQQRGGRKKEERKEARGQCFYFKTKENGRV